MSVICKNIIYVVIFYVYVYNCYLLYYASETYNKRDNSYKKIKNILH